MTAYTSRIVASLFDSARIFPTSVAISPYRKLCLTLLSRLSFISTLLSLVFQLKPSWFFIQGKTRNYHLTNPDDTLDKIVFFGRIWSSKSAKFSDGLNNFRATEFLRVAYANRNKLLESVN